MVGRRGARDRPKTTLPRSGSESGRSSRPRCRPPPSTSGSSRSARSGRAPRRSTSPAPARVRTWVERRYLDQLEALAAAPRGRASSGSSWSTPSATASAGEEPRRAVAEPLPIDPAHTFDRFVIGPGSRFAHAAALAVAELPGEAYNPLFLHGPPGLGKTHLLGAIAGYYRDHHPELTVHYTTAERFTSEFVAALRTEGPERFKERYRGLDALLIDDVQVLEGKPRTEEEFVHTFNALFAAGKQIVLSSDRPPGSLVAARAAPARPLRVGPRGRGRAARPAHPGRAALALRRRRGRAAPRARRPARRSRPACPATCAGSRARSPACSPSPRSSTSRSPAPALRRALPVRGDRTTTDAGVRHRARPSPRSRRPSSSVLGVPRAGLALEAAHAARHPRAAARDVPHPRAHVALARADRARVRPRPLDRPPRAARSSSSATSPAPTSPEISTASVPPLDNSRPTAGRRRRIPPRARPSTGVINTPFPHARSRSGRCPQPSTPLIHLIQVGR